MNTVCPTFFMTREIPSIPKPDSIDTTRPDEVLQIRQWLLENVTSLIGESHLRGSADISVAPRPSKKTEKGAGDAINDYTTSPGLNTVSADVVDADGNLFCTHGVIFATKTFQNFGKVEDLETVVVRSGSLQYTVDGTPGVAVAGAVIDVDKGQELQVQSTVPTDYTCFYGEKGRNHVRQCLDQAD